MTPAGEDTLVRTWIIHSRGSVLLKWPRAIADMKLADRNLASAFAGGGKLSGDEQIVNSFAKLLQ